MLRIFFFLIVVVLSSCESKTPLLKSGTIAAGNLQVYYEQTGKGQPLVLLHAGLQNSTMWQAQVDELSKDFNVITIDLPYHGKTSGADTNILAKDVVKAVIDSLGLSKVSIAGLSMGASIAQDFMIAHPAMVDKAILLSAGINGYEEKFQLDSTSMNWYKDFSKSLNSNDTAGAAKAFTAAWAEGLNFDGGSFKKPVSKIVYETTLATLKQHKMLGWPKLQDQPTAINELHKITSPVLIIHGDKDLPFITSASAYLEKTIKGSRRILINDLAHMLNMEKPREVNKLMKDFLLAN